MKWSLEKSIHWSLELQRICKQLTNICHPRLFQRSHEWKSNGRNVWVTRAHSSYNNAGAFTVIMELFRWGCVLSRVTVPRGHIFSRTELRLPYIPCAGRVSISSHEWSMWRSESTASSIVTVVDIVVVIRWFKFLTRDSCCQARRKRRSHFHATSTAWANCSLFLFPPRASFPRRVTIVSKRSLLARLSYVQLARARAWGDTHVNIFALYKPRAREYRLVA